MNASGRSSNGLNGFKAGFIERISLKEQFLFLIGKKFEIITGKYPPLYAAKDVKNFDFSFCGNCAKTLEFHGVALFFYRLSTVAMSIIIVLLRFVNCYVHRPR